jgi:hypothetical protein
MMWEMLSTRELKAPNCSDEPEVGRENLHRGEPEWVVDSEILYGKRALSPAARCVVVAVKSE